MSLPVSLSLSSTTAFCFLFLFFFFFDLDEGFLFIDWVTLYGTNADETGAVFAREDVEVDAV